MDKKTCFVVMGFGKKTDFQNGRVVDLDKSYKNIIKPAVEDAGLTCIRADDIQHSGIIDVPMYEYLLKADVVVADLSTYNVNACYELGVRHALKPYTTIIVAESKFKNPFDLSHIVIRSYEHMGEGIDFDEVVRFRGELKTAIEAILAQPKNDSPVYEFLKQLRPPEIAAAIAEAVSGPETAPVPPPANDQTVSKLMSKVEDAFRAGRFVVARTYLEELHDLLPTDSYIVQKMALATYKSEDPSPQEALEEAKLQLLKLDPKGSNDTETLGLWGAIHKRLWELTRDRAHLDESVFAYEKGFYLKNDYYNGINLAFLLNMRAALPDARSAEAIADFVLAQRTRRKVLAICQTLLASEKERGKPLPDHYWVAATLGEALFGLGERADAQKILDAAYAGADAAWMKQSTQDQLKKLDGLLAQFPQKAAVAV